MNQPNEEQLTDLAPSGTSPWNHQASIEQGKLTLYWQMANGGTRVRTFTEEETRVLYEMLREGLEGK